MKLKRTYEKKYRSWTSGDPEERGEAHSPAEDNIEELLENAFIKINPLDDVFKIEEEVYSQRFIAQNGKKDIFYIELTGDKPSVGEGSYTRCLSVVGYSAELPGELVGIILEKGFKLRTD